MLLPFIRTFISKSIWQLALHLGDYVPLQWLPTWLMSLRSRSCLVRFRSMSLTSSLIARSVSDALISSTPAWLALFSSSPVSLTVFCRPSAAKSNFSTVCLAYKKHERHEQLIQLIHNLKVIPIPLCNTVPTSSLASWRSELHTRRSLSASCSWLRRLAKVLSKASISFLKNFLLLPARPMSSSSVQDSSNTLARNRLIMVNKYIL